MNSCKLPKQSDIDKLFGIATKKKAKVKVHFTEEVSLTEPEE